MIQTRIVNYANQKLSEKSGYPIYIDYLDLGWLDEVHLKGVSINDVYNNDMIKVKQINMNIAFFNLLTNNTINIEEATLINPVVTVSFDSARTINLNNFVIAINNLLKGNRKPNDPKVELTAFALENATIINGVFRLYDYKYKPMKDDVFDYRNIKFDSINAKLQNFYVHYDTVSFGLKHLDAVHPINDLNIEELSTDFFLTKQSMDFKHLFLKTEKSLLKDELKFKYNSLKDMNDFNNLINIEAHIKESNIDTEELAYFSPFFKNKNQNIFINAIFMGRVNSFNLKNFMISIDSQSYFSGQANIDGLPDFQSSFIDLKLNKVKIIKGNFEPHLTNEEIKPLIQLGDFDFHGKFTGFPYDFVANGSFTTAFGNFDTDINLKIDQKTKTSEYSGKLNTYDFEFGRLTNNENLFNKITMNGAIKGTGLSFDDANFDLNADIERFEIYGYAYNNIKTDAQLNKSLFNGYLSINDPNFKGEFTALVDASHETKKLLLDGRIDTLFTAPLHFYYDDISLNSKVYLNLEGTNINDVIGDVKLKNTNFSKGIKHLTIPKLLIDTEIKSGNRNFHFTSPYLDIKSTGQYHIDAMISKLNAFYSEYKLNLENDSKKIAEYYTEKNRLSNIQGEIENENLAFDIDIKNLNPVFEFLSKPVSIAKESSISGNFRSGETFIFNLYGKVDSLSISNISFYKNSFELSASKISKNPEVLSVLSISSEQQDYPKIAGSEAFNFNAWWAKNKLEFETSVSQVSSKSEINIGGNILFLRDTIEMHLSSAKLKFIDEDWHINNNNGIKITQDKVIFDSLSIATENQFIGLHGLYSENPEELLNFEIIDLKMANFNPLTKLNFLGKIKGKAAINKQNDTQLWVGNLSIDSLQINNFLVGNIAADLSKNEKNVFEVNVHAERDNKPIFVSSGKYRPFRDRDQLDMSAHFDQLDIGIIEPFLDQYISEVKGDIYGDVMIKGSIREPILNGLGTIKNGHIKVNYLNTAYHFNGQLVIDETTIGVDQLILSDLYGNTATFNGGLYHNGFENIIINFIGDFKNFLVLNTDIKDNSLYYGQGIGTGQLEILGSFSNLLIKAKAKTEKGTKFFLPFGGTEEVKHADFINFKKPKSKTIKLKRKQKTKVKKLNFDLDLEITPDAYSEIIFDIKSGDIIKGRAKGNLRLNIDPKGAFDLYGELSVVEGGYTFTMKNIFSKEFELKPNSTIRWFGDPYLGDLDLKATYAQNANLAPFFDTLRVNQNPDLKRKYLSKVLLNLQGPLLQPDITFDLDFTAYPYTLNNQIDEIKSRLNADEQELNRQVFSLIFLGKYSPLGSFEINGNSAFGSSVSEYLSNQLSYWVTQVDDNLEIDIDLGSLNEDTFNNFQLRLSYTFLDGRLRITRDGGFTDGNNQANLSSIAGDWSVEYLLTPDGRLRVKMYNRNNYNTITSEIQNAISTGFSISYTKNFDELRELWRRAKLIKEE